MKKERPRGDLVMAFKYLKGDYKEWKWAFLCEWGHRGGGDRTRSSGLKLQQMEIGRINWRLRGTS